MPSRLVTRPSPLISTQCPAVSTWRLLIGVAVQMNRPRRVETARLPTPANGDVVVFGSTRLAGESAGTPFGSPAARSGNTSPSGKADRTSRDSSNSRCKGRRAERRDLIPNLLWGKIGGSAGHQGRLRWE